jgi:hypothetical protein
MFPVIFSAVCVYFSALLRSGLLGLMYVCVCVCVCVRARACACVKCVLIELKLNFRASKFYVISRVIHILFLI